MNKNMFYAYEGGNSAIYIFNLSSFKNISISLEFYKPLGRKRKILKKGFYLYLCAWRVMRECFSCKYLMNRSDVQELLSVNMDSSVDFNVDGTCSIFIPSGGDKVIVNHHNNYFEKFAFDNSYKKSCNEIKVYSALQERPAKYFMISAIKDIKDYNGYCSFKLYNEFNKKKQSIVSNRVLIRALVELFQVIPSKNKSVAAICSQIRDNFSASKQTTESTVGSILRKIENNFGGAEVSLGLVHWDFKIWNIQAYKNEILIYDFEESKLDGLPLEDLYNYHIDSRIMMGENTKNIAIFINSDFLKEQLAAYSKSLNIQTSDKLLLLFYLLNRVYFYQISDNKYIAQRYLEVLKFMENDIFRAIQI